MEIKDLAGISQPLTKLIEVVSAGVGRLYNPYLIKKTANAIAYEITVIAQAMKENQDDVKSIEFNEEKLSLMSLDDDSLKNSLPLVHRAQNRVEFQEQKRQKNIENITQKAAESLESESEVADDPVDEDWISRFFNYAADISSEDMQKLWGRLLAGEIKQPKSFSLRTLDVLRNFSAEEAELFRKFGSLAFSDHNLQSHDFILQFDKEPLLEEKYQLTLHGKLVLQDLGLLSSGDILCFMLPKSDDNPSKIIFKIKNTIIIQTKLPNKPKQELNILAFTKTGSELLQLINVEPQMDYLQLLATKLDRDNGSIKYANFIRHLADGGIEHSNPLVDIPLTDRERDALN